jgi:rhodanese-related sulfurtransferase
MFLRQRGLDAVNLEGGILAWGRRVDPNVRQY